MNATALTVAVSLALAATSVLADAGTALRVCLASDDAPRADRASGTGLDIDLARLLARELDRPLELVWLPELGEIDEVSDFNFRPLVAGDCDLHLSVPGVEGLGGFARALRLSVSYYGAAYELIPASADWRWGEPFHGTIAVMANSIAHIAVDAAALRWSMRPTTRDIVQAVADDEAAMGLVWGPDLAATEVSRTTAFTPPQALRWNLHAATRADDALLDAVNGVFAAAAFESRMAAILTRHGVPVRPPFESVYSREALDAIRGP